MNSLGFSFQTWLTRSEFGKISYRISKMTLPVIPSFLDKLIKLSIIESEAYINNYNKTTTILQSIHQPRTLRIKIRFSNSVTNVETASRGNFFSLENSIKQLFNTQVSTFRHQNNIFNTFAKSPHLLLPKNGLVSLHKTNFPFFYFLNHKRIFLKKNFTKVA